MNIDQHFIPFGSAEFQVGIADVAAQQIAVLIHHPVFQAAGVNLGIAPPLVARAVHRLHQ